MVTDPTLVDLPRYSDDGRLDWRAIASGVVDAVQFAQQKTTSPFEPSISVEIDALPDRELYVVAEWLSARPPEFEPSVDLVTDGRHRTWHARQAGATEVPALNSPMSDAVRAWNDTDGFYLMPDHETLAAWREERRWWDKSVASSWSIRNKTHLRLWDEALKDWATRL